MDYATLKLVHQGAVALSIAGFAARGVAALLESRWVRARVARTLPHVIDTVLLASAIALAWRLRLNPIDTPWLAAKIVGLLLYIALGMVALRPALPRAIRAAAFVAALLCFAQIAAMAHAKSVAGWFAWL
jgi:uncharacterized membrane protein SirB2